MRLLDGRELAGYVKERQAKQVRGLRQAWQVFPKLVIVIANDDPASEAFVRLKQTYGEDILIDVDVRRIAVDGVLNLIHELNVDDSVHGIVVQLPLAKPERTDEIVAAIDPAKDVDGLGPNAEYQSATATAIDWLLAGYNITLTGRTLAIVGQGRLVGRPLANLWRGAGLDVVTYDDTTTDLRSALRGAEVVVSATGVPGLITADMLAPGAVVVDAGTAVENGQLVGDVANDVRERADLTITPAKGGVGPLTVAALFDNVITAARQTAATTD